MEQCMRIGFSLTVVFLLYAPIAYRAAGPLEWITYPTRAFLIVAGDVFAGLLAMTFLPGTIAAFWQLFRGTATRPFPVWFGTWLAIRKQLGLLAFAIAIPHVIMACKRGRTDGVEDPQSARSSIRGADRISSVLLHVLLLERLCIRALHVV